MRHSIETCKAQSSLEQSKQPRNAIWPACLVDEIAVDEIAGRVIWRCTGENGDRDDDEAGDRPGKGTTGDPRKEIVGECIDTKSHNIIPNVDEKLMPAFGIVILEGSTSVEPGEVACLRGYTRIWHRG